MTELAWRKKAPTVRVEDPPPGQEAQVDFGEMGLVARSGDRQEAPPPGRYSS
ncbi:MAG: hypothetical protein IPM79_31815 [Polyangiaceae bacterium]|nr:hypothetical protein [Polyangiaceae bacterium]